MNAKREPVRHRDCMFCNETFKPKKNTPIQRYCRRKCSDEAKKQRSHEVRHCVICYDAFRIKKHKTTRTCSVKCRGEYKQRNVAVKWNCGRCNKEVESCKSHMEYHSYCSVDCQNKAAIELGEAHWSGVPFSLRSPDNRVWTGKNINSFVRDHTELFSGEDIVKRRGGNRASNGLRLLVREGVGWKGWTLNLRGNSR